MKIKYKREQKVTLLDSIKPLIEYIQYETFDILRSLYSLRLAHNIHIHKLNTI